MNLIIRILCLWLILALVANVLALLFHPWIILPAAIVLCGLLMSKSV
jgi:hypothetical protein